MPLVPSALELTLALRGGRRAAALLARADVVLFAGPRHVRERMRWEAEYARVHPFDKLYHRVWSDAAAATGASCERIALGRFALARGEARAEVQFNETPLDDDATLALALDRLESNRRFEALGIPIPEQVTFTVADRQPVRDLIARHGPVVVKPASGTFSGDGITAGIGSEDELIRAAVRAARSDETLVAERQLTGDEHRLLFLDGRLLDVVRRRPPTITGDGRTRIGALIAQENMRRLAARGEEGLHLLTVDLDAVLTLRRAGLTLRSVPGNGERVTIKRLASQAGRRDSERVAPGDLPPGLVEQSRSAGEAVGLRLWGVDAIGDTIIEVNGTPGLHYHEHVDAPPLATPVAVPILEALLAS